MLTREGRAENTVQVIDHQIEGTVLVEGRLSENVRMRGEKNQQSWHAGEETARTEATPRTKSSSGSNITEKGNGYHVEH